MLEETLQRVLSKVTEFSIATGDATDGSTTTLVDTGSVWEVNKWADAVVEITQSFQVLTLAPAPVGYVNCVPADIGKMVQDDGVDAGLLLNYNNALRVWQIRTTTTIVSGSVMTIPTGTGAGIAAISVTSTIHYYVTITSNTADTLTFPAIVVAVVAGDHYEIRMPLKIVTTQTAAMAGQTPVGVNVTTASTQILAANANRKCAPICNDSDTTMWLAIGQAAVANRGIRLNANGGVLVISINGDIYSTEAVNAIHAGVGNKVATVQELN